MLITTYISPDFFAGIPFPLRRNFLPCEDPAGMVNLIVPVGVGTFTEEPKAASQGAIGKLI